jgi:two-component system, chemotaxis family, sensor kinase CheA
MSGLAETLWQEFAVETDEHLLGLEPLLVRLGSAEAEADDVARLFRAVHSLKGLARAMALYGMEAVAHRAENLLGLVRDGGIAVTEAMLDGLLEAVDTLRVLRETAVAERQDAAPPASLLQRLDALFEAAGGSEAKAPSAPPPASSSSSELSDDGEMLGLFVELLQTRLPELAGAFAADDAIRGELVDTLETLEHAAGVMQFEQFTETLHDLRELLAAQRFPLDVAARREATGRIAQVQLQARLLSEVSGSDGGANGLAAALVDALTADRVAALVELAAVLAQFELDTVLDDPARVRREASNAVAASRAVQAILQCLDMPRAVDILLLVEDVSVRLAQGELAPSTLLASVMRFAVEAIAEQAGESIDLDEAEAADLTRGIRAALQSDTVSAESQQVDATLAELKGGPAMREVLSAANVGDLAAGISAGENVYELMLYLEDSPSIGEAIVAWLTSDAKIISNRTVLTNGDSWFDFLIVSAHPPDIVRDALLARDPGRQCVKSLRQVGGDTLLSDVAEAGGMAVPVAGTATQAARATSTVLRVRSDVIDAFMTQIGEIRVAAAELSDLVESRDAAGRVRDGLSRDDAVAAAAALETQRRAVAGLARGLETELRRLQAAALELRVVPIDTILNRFPRVVRALAQEQGKNVRLTLEGRDVRVDKSMVELLVDPLMHMVRNAVDHGVEAPEERVRAGKPVQASITLRAVQRGGEVHVQVADDGRGLDERAIVEKAVARALTQAGEAGRLKPHEIHRFIFAPGFSTASRVTETSGRGVGMDVVLNTVQQLGGDIDVETSIGNGTVFTLRLPLSAALQTSLIVRVNGQNFGIAERFVASVVEVPAEEMLAIGRQSAIAHKDGALPVYRLADLLWQGEPEVANGRSFRSIVVISNGRESIGLEVDRVRRRQELFLKELHPLLAACPTVNGAAVLGDGRVVLLLDADELIQLARSGSWRGAPEAAMANGAGA